MPKDVIYPFEMPSYGNIATCEAQGLVYIVGNAFVFCMNALLNQEMLNPSPTYPFCVVNTYPLTCTKADNPECRGGGDGSTLAPLFYCTITLFFFTLMITMALIVYSFFRNERRLRKALKDKPSQEVDAKYEALKRAQETSSIITWQALMYVAAFLITWIFGFVQFLGEEWNVNEE
eukprot:scaffold7564_cov154-Chaetoceros_neogracile.AAC.1